MSQISAAPLRTTYCVFQIGSKLARSACGTKRSARAEARCEIAGVAIPPAAATAPAPAAAVRDARRSMMISPDVLKDLRRAPQAARGWAQSVLFAPWGDLRLVFEVSECACQ